MPRHARRSVFAAAALLLACGTGDLRAQVNMCTLSGEGPGQEYLLNFSEGGEKLSDVLDLFKNLLAMPVDYLPEEVGGNMVRIDGPQHIAVDHVRDALESLLERHRFWCWDDVSGGSPQLVVRLKSGPRASLGPGFTPRVVSLEELAAGPTPRTPLYIVAFKLEHVSAVSTMTVLASWLEPGIESVRVTDSNVLLVKASRAHLLQIRDILAASDIPAPVLPVPEGLAALEGRLAALEKHLAMLEQRLAAIEARLPLAGK